nr:helix-turn-helix domain-containing protein [uncultured Eisenbergiella sp.]
MESSTQEVYRVVFKSYPDVLNAEQVAEMLGICTKTVYKLVKRGDLPALKVGRQYRVAKVNVIKYMKMLQLPASDISAPTK